MVCEPSRDPGVLRRAVLRWALSAISISLLFSACSTADTPGSADKSSEPLAVFAAANLRSVLDNIARNYHARTGDSVVLVFGSTTSLGTQIINGAPADLFLAANTAAIDSLAARDLIVDSTRAVYATGRLILVGNCAKADQLNPSPRCSAPQDIASLAQDSYRSIAIANPAFAPYGLAAETALQRSGVLPRIQDRLVLAANVNQALQYALTGNADAAIVALALVADDNSYDYSLVDTTLYDPIVQSLAVLRGSAHQQRALAFRAFLLSPEVQRVINHYEPH